MKTIDDLQAAFSGESQANRKYLAFAKKAEREGYTQVAKLFRAVAAAETVHAHNHFRVLGEIKSTAENLEAAIGGETLRSQRDVSRISRRRAGRREQSSGTLFRLGHASGKAPREIVPKSIRKPGRRTGRGGVLGLRDVWAYARWAKPA